MKKWLIRIAYVIGGIMALLVIAGSVFYYNQAPDYEENISLEGFKDNVNIYYDQYAIPHIYANNNYDAFRALGYVHAKERLWQMELLRRIAPGRLSEIFGEAGLENDKFFRTIGLGQQSAKEAVRFLENATPVLKESVLAYVSGINQFIEVGKMPIEYRILGIEKTPYTLEDVYNVIGYMAFSFTLAHKTEPIVDFIDHILGRKYLEVMDMHVHPGTTTINSEMSTDYSPISLHINQLLRELPVPELIGSNSWVLGGKKTKSGSVILANDPHIGFTQPAVWFEAHIEAPGISLYGNYLAGFPFAQIGHTRHHAIGLTMFENDDLDYYRERINPDNTDEYWAIDHWEPFTQRVEEIKIKDGAAVLFEVRETRHGPVISDVVSHLKSDDPVSMWWIYQKFPLQILEASSSIMFSQSMEGVRLGASLIHAPGLNVMYGDTEGNIAWWAAAKLPIRPEHVNSKTILDGASGKDDVLGYYHFNENPQAVNPKQDYVYSANNQPLSHDSIRHPGYYLPEDRARRITNLISEKNDWTIQEVQKMMLDVTSENAPEIVSSILSGINVSDFPEDIQNMVTELANWNGNYDIGQVAPTVYVKLIYHILNAMTQDELAGRWETFNGTHLMKRSIQPMIANETSPWWDDINTTPIESKKDILHKAIEKTYYELDTQLGPELSAWTWGKVHTLEHPHAFDLNTSIKSFFNVGPFAVPGATEVINNFQFITTDDGTYEVKAGPSSRRAIQLSDFDNNSWGILPTGQSGNVFSAHYKDQAEMFIRGNFRKQLMNQNEIILTHKYHTLISPEPN